MTDKNLEYKTNENEQSKLGLGEIPRDVVEIFKALDMVQEMQKDALSGLMRGSYREMEDSIKKVEVLTELQQSGIFPYQDEVTLEELREYQKELWLAGKPLF